MKIIFMVRVHTYVGFTHGMPKNFKYSTLLLYSSRESYNNKYDYISNSFQ